MSLTPTTYLLSHEFLRRGFTVRAFDDGDLLLVEKNGKKWFTHSSKVVQQSSSNSICKDKYLSKQVLQYFGFPTAKGKKVTQGTIDMVDELRFPVAVKPLSLSGGKDVEVNIPTKEKVAAYLQSHPDYTEILVEEMLEGEDTRILIVGGKFFAACKREPAYVIGDGIHTIEELVSLENEYRRKVLDEEEKSKKYWEDFCVILFDEESQRVLQLSGMTKTTVPPKDEKVFVRSNANVSTGGIAVDVTDQVCEDIRFLCEDIASKLHMSLLGVDIFSQQLNVPLEKQERAGIVEVNSSPGLGLHAFARGGEPRNAAPLLVNELEAYLFNS